MKLLSKLMARHKDYRLKKKFPALNHAFQIATHLTLQERCQLYLLAVDTKAILEIGSYIGASACCFGAAMKSRKKDGKIYCIDTWNNDAMTEGCRDTWEEFQKNTASYKEYIIPIRGFSTNVVSEVASHIKTIDLLFIDGDHSYEAVKSDWDSYKMFLKEGSIVVFHDYGWAEGVNRVIIEEVKPLVSSMNSLPNMWWGTINK
jgi:predicted O-methyltransferase YrrM